MRYCDDFPIPEIGDKVLVRHDLNPDELYGHLHNASITNSVTLEMYNLAGHYVTIRNVYSRIKDDDAQYEIEGLPGLGWVTGMFDLNEFMIKPIDISKDDLMEFLK